MKLLDTRRAMQRALKSDTPPDLAPLLQEHLRHTIDAGLAEITTIIVLEACDPEETLAAALGRSLLINPLDGSRFGERGFQPDLDWLRRRGSFFEAFLCVGNDGFAFIILIEDRADELGNVCRQFSST